MRIEEVIIENFRSHKLTNVKFTRGINLIVGQNGSGKSSLLDAILVGFYWDKPRAILKKDDFQRVGGSSTKITVFFEKDGLKYQVYRDITNGLAFVKCYENGEWKRLESGQRAVKDWMERLISYDVFVNAVYVRQGEIEAILESDESRDKLVRQVLGLEKFENAYKNLQEVKKRIRDRIDSIRDYLKETSNIDRLISDMEDELSKTSREIENLEKEIPKIEKDLEEVSKCLEFYDDLEKRINKTLMEIKDKESDLKELNTQLKNVRDQMEESKKMIEELEVLVRELDSIEDDAKLYEKLESLRRLFVDEKAKIERQIDACKQKIENVERRIEEVEKKAEKVKEFEKIKKDCIERIEELRTCVEDYEKIKNLKSRLFELRKELKFDEEGIRKLEEEIESAKVRRDEIIERLKEIRERVGGLDNRAKELKKAILELKKAKGKCPVCGAELTDEHRIRLIENYKREFGKIKKDKNDLENEERKLRYELTDVERILKKEKEFFRQKDIFEQIERIEEELGNYDFEGLEKAYAEFENLRNKVQKLEGQISTLRSEIEMLGELKSEREGFLKRLKFLETKLTEIEKNLKDAGFYNLEELDKTISNLKPKYERYMELKRVRDDLAREREKIERLRKDEMEMVEKLTTLKDEVNLLKDKLLKMKSSYSEEKHERLKDEEKSLRDALVEKVTKLKVLKKKRVEVENGLERLRGERNRRKAKEDELKSLERAEKKIQELREKVKRFKAMLRERALAEVGEIASKIFEELTEEKYSGVVVKAEENKVRLGVVYNGREFGLGFLSGGERIALGLAFRLALSLYLAGEMSLLMLDEPTPFLDEERRRKLVEIMNRYLRKIPQVIVVSHDEELRESADRVVRVSLENGVSRVETCIG